MVTGRRRQRWEREEKIRLEKINEKFINLYISNFPDDWAEASLKEILEKFVGKVVDVSIPNKRAKDGKHFAFVRFQRVRDEEALVNRVKGVWIGLYKLLANKAQFNKLGEMSVNREQGQNRGHQMQTRTQLDPWVCKDRRCKGQWVSEGILRIEVNGFEKERG